MLRFGNIQVTPVQDYNLLRLVDRSLPVGKVLRLLLHLLESFVIALNLATVRLDL